MRQTKKPIPEPRGSDGRRRPAAFGRIDAAVFALTACAVLTLGFLIAEIQAGSTETAFMRGVFLHLTLVSSGSAASIGFRQVRRRPAWFNVFPTALAAVLFIAALVVYFFWR